MTMTMDRTIVTDVELDDGSNRDDFDNQSLRLKKEGMAFIIF